jgi:PKD repeat protein
VLWSGEIGEGLAVTITYRAGVHTGIAPGAIITNAATVDGGIGHPPFDTPPTTVTVLCRALSEVGFDYEPPTPVEGQVVTFSATATGSLPITFTWDLGDGTGIGGAIVTQTYEAEGEYQVMLTATNACDQEVVTRTVAVAPRSQWIYLPLLRRDS